MFHVRYRIPRGRWTPSASYTAARPAKDYLNSKPLGTGFEYAVFYKGKKLSPAELNRLAMSCPCCNRDLVGLQQSGLYFPNRYCPVCGRQACLDCLPTALEPCTECRDGLKDSLK